MRGLEHGPIAGEKGAPLGNGTHTSARGLILVAIDLLSMPGAVECYLLAEDIVADAVRPGLKTPLADTLSLEFLDLWRWAKGVGFQPLDCFENPLSS